jgi:transglutaminase-like putative cysteine protease
VLEAIRRANQPRAPEHSVRLRVATTCAVLVAIGASVAESTLAPATAVLAAALVVAGMVFSHATRERPPWWIKVLVAIAAVAALVWFTRQLSAIAGEDITSVEDLLTGLFGAILVVHSFHVPSRRDLMFSLGSSGALMAAAAAQAVDLHFAWYALGWAALSLWTLVEGWVSASGGGQTSIAGLIAALVGVTAVAAAVFLVLPAPSFAVRIDFLARQGSGGSVGIPGTLAGDAGGAGQAAEPSRPGSPAGRTRVGGYLGFANRLDTALRGNLSHTVVMRVRAQRPSYWVGETFDSWDGQSWGATRIASHAAQGSPFTVPTPQGDIAGSQTDLQTFYVATSTPDLVFHAENATELWFPTSTVFYGDDGTIVSPIGLGKGTIYTVESSVSAAAPQQLREAGGGDLGRVFGGGTLPPALQRRYTQLPHAYPRVQALAQAITAGAPTTYDRIQALIAWMGANTHYSTDTPPLPAGADTVDEFLFGNRVGFCEQISTSLAVMLRTLDIPVRETVGYVPGPYNPVTDLYEVRASDAHAWVQVWFPGYGWQSFDPTAAVPLANPAPGATALTEVGHALRSIPVVPVVVAVAGAGLAVAVGRRRRSRPRTWAEQVSRRIERAGRRAGRPRRASETITEYATDLDHISGDGSLTWSRLAGAVEGSAYGGRQPPPGDRREILASARRSRVRSAAAGRTIGLITSRSFGQKVAASEQRRSPSGGGHRPGDPA